MSILNKWWVWAAFIVGVSLFVGASMYFPFALAFVAAILFVVIDVALLHFIDDKFLKGVDTYDEIVKHNNLAYAVYMLGICGIIAAANIAAVVPFIAYMFANNSPL